MYRVYCHKDFQRGESDLARQMVPKRKRVKPQGNQFALPDSNQVNHQQEISPANSFVSGAVEAANALTKLHPPHVIENLRLMLRPLAELEPSSPPETLCVGTTAHTSSPTTTIWTNEGTMPLASGAHHWDASLANAMFSDSTVQGFARHLTGVCDQKQCGLLENDSAGLNLNELMNLPLNDDSLLSSSTRRCSMSFYDTSLDDFEPTLLW